MKNLNNPNFSLLCAFCGWLAYFNLGILDLRCRSDPTWQQSKPHLKPGFTFGFTWDLKMYNGKSVSSCGLLLVNKQFPLMVLFKHWNVKQTRLLSSNFLTACNSDPLYIPNTLVASFSGVYFWSRGLLSWFTWGLL